MPEQSKDKPSGKQAAAEKQRPDKAGADKQRADKPRPEKKGDKGAAEKHAAEKQAPEIESEDLPHGPARLQQFYRNEVMGQLKSDLQLANAMQVPRITKITVNMGVGEAITDRKLIDAAAGDLAKITGQKPKICRARKAVASFKLREGLPIGCMVTLRGARMYEFLDRLISIAMPRIRDFRGVSPRGFDGRGNYSFGVREQIIFPEIQYDAIDQVRGMDITITTTARDNKQGRALLEAFRFPFRK
jgi:large subunit ribosomal protein L5